METCGFGCGLLNYKGVELANDAGALALIKPELAAGHTPQVLGHEMGHNFDIYHDYLGYWPDSAHAWTWFLDHYVFVYNLEGVTPGTYAGRGSPNSILDDGVRTSWGQYYPDPTKTWDRCMRDQQCGNPNPYWAGTLYRFVQLHGPDAIRGYMDYLHQYKSTRPVPATPEVKNDLHVEAMAAGVGLNLGCYVDAWRWHASPDARNRMTVAYGSTNRMCDDADGDGFSPLTGDCDDNDPNVHPGATESANGKDNDCNGVAGDILFTEPAGGDFPALQPVSFPARIKGQITVGDADTFSFSLSTAKTVTFTLTSDPDFQGWLFAQLPPESGLVPIIYTLQGGTSSYTASLPAGSWRFSVVLNNASLPGGYQASIKEAENWPDYWGVTRPPQNDRQTYHLTATLRTAAHLLRAPSDVRFWVAGFGWVGSIPYQPRVDLTWVPAEGLSPGFWGYRAQLFDQGIPVSEATPPQWFEVSPPISFYSLTPCRVVDTRNSDGAFGGPALAAAVLRTFTITGQCGIPTSARSVSVNVTVTQPASGGFLTLFPGGGIVPPTSTVNYRAGQTRANNAVLSMGSSGDISAVSGQPSGAVHLILDVNGYFQ